jgi:hypothetical protein
VFKIPEKLAVVDEALSIQKRFDYQSLLTNTSEEDFIGSTFCKLLKSNSRSTGC